MLILAALSVTAAVPEKVEFNRHVRPILSENCFACHGPDRSARKADLRLDQRGSAIEARDGARALVPGDVASSEVMARITHADPDERMPPESTNKRLTDHEVAILKRWIEQGAEYQPHWSFIAPVRPPVPAMVHPPDGFVIRNPIDAFVLRDLEMKGWRPSPQADLPTLVRRLHLDVIGLPPNPVRIAIDGAGFDEAAYAQMVDGLLASHHYGERMATGWLDLVRYADTVGYHGDQEVSVAPFRAFVIRSFNRNARFDDFTREQLAGDRLAAKEPPGRRRAELLVASGFNRLNMTTEEGGSQPKEYLVKYMTDRVRTTATTWLGATMGCAQCHDHKFDPYTMKDFYSFGAFFADIEEVGVYGGNGNRPPDMRVPDDRAHARLDEIDRTIVAVEADLGRESPELEAARKVWEASVLESLTDGRATDLVWLDDEPPPGAQLGGNWSAIDAKQGPVFSGRRSWRQQGGATTQHFFHRVPQSITLGADDVFFVHVFLDAKNPPKSVMLQAHSSAHGGWDHRAFWGEDRIEYGGIGSAGPAHYKAGALPETGKWVRLEVSAGSLGFVGGQTIDGFSFDQHAGTVFWDGAGVKSRDAAVKSRAFPEAVLSALRTPETQRSNENRRALDSHFRSVGPALAPLRERLSALRAEREAVLTNSPKTLITAAVTPRVSRVLPRGNWMDESGPVVEPAVPVFLDQSAAPRTDDASARGTQRLDRLDLANWLVSPENPLTARVFVNRLWKQFFGTGLSRQLDELGSQGEWPLHPELLDWLSVEFRESDWDVKHMVRLIVTSSTYRQASILSESQIAAGQTYEADPDNRWLGRQSRFRLDAELVRDNALAVSGLLVDIDSVHSAKPYQPAGYYAQLNFPTREYQADADANQWRRGVHMHWQRTFLHPMLMAFDAPSRDECAASRVVSNTPLQALVLLNDPTFVEAARAFAVRVIREAGSIDTDSRIDWAFRQALARPPRDSERRIVRELASSQLERFGTDPESANRFLSVGLNRIPAGLAPAEVAAWAAVARAILNLHDTVTRS